MGRRGQRADGSISIDCAAAALAALLESLLPPGPQYIITRGLDGRRQTEYIGEEEEALSIKER